MNIVPSCHRTDHVVAVTGSLPWHLGSLSAAPSPQQLGADILGVDATEFPHQFFRPLVNDLRQHNPHTDDQIARLTRKR